MSSRCIRVATLTLAAMCTPAFIGIASADDGEYVRTQSGRVRCLVYANDVFHGGGPLVACEHTPGFPQAPTNASGHHWNLAVVRASGAFNWDTGNIGGASGTISRDIVLEYGKTYHVNGWIINPDSHGTKFTHSTTGHGMFVSVENVKPF